MPGTPTTRFAIPTVAGTDLARDLDTEITAGFTAVDSKMTGWGTGLLAARPVSTGGSPGVAGRIYRATDTGQWFIDHGTGWDELPAAPLATADLADAAVTSRKVAPTILTAEDDSMTQALSTTEADVTGSVINVTPAVVSTVVVQGTVALSNGAGITSIIQVRQDSTNDIMPFSVTPAGVLSEVPIPVLAVFTGVTAAAHTYRLRARNGGGSSSVVRFRLMATVYAQ